MKIVIKCTGMNNYLVYLKDDNDNSLECYEFIGDDVGRMKKETELMVQYNLGLGDLIFVPLSEYVAQRYEDDLPETKSQYPLILVFYLDRELLAQPEIRDEFIKAVNSAIAIRNANIMAFFMPTDGEERIECINPLQVSKADMFKINAMVDEIAKQFDIGQGADDGKSEDDGVN